MIQSILDSNNKSICDVRIHSQCQCGIKLIFRDIFGINYNNNCQLVDSNRQSDIIHSWSTWLWVFFAPSVISLKIYWFTWKKEFKNLRHIRMICKHPWCIFLRILLIMNCFLFEALKAIWLTNRIWFNGCQF